jgi:short-subunit dehydrogenase involved in D-alanine esterification of teichoic acids
MGAQVVALGRSSSKLADLKEELPSIRTVKVDLSDLSPFRKLPINLSHPSHESISLSNGGYMMDMVITRHRLQIRKVTTLCLLSIIFLTFS